MPHKQMPKKGKGKFFLLGIFVVFIGLLFFLSVQNQQLVAAGGNLGGETTLIEETEEYYHYLFDYRVIPATTTCDDKEIYQFSFSITPSIEQSFSPPSDAQLDTFFQAEKIQFNNLDATSRPCTDSPTSGVDFGFVEKSGQCLLRGEKPRGLVCDFSGAVKSTTGEQIVLGGLTGGSAEVKIYKQGFSPQEITENQDLIQNSPIPDPLQNLGGDVSDLTKGKISPIGIIMAFFLIILFGTVGFLTYRRFKQ